MEVKKFFKIWPVFIARNLQSKMAYKLDFFLGIIATFLTQLLGFMLLWVVFSQLKNLAGWSYTEVLFMYGFAAVPNGLVEFFLDGIWDISDRYVIKGELDRLLTRPMNPLLSIVAAHMEPHGLGSVLFGLGVCAVTGYQLNLSLDVWKVIFFILAIVSGTMIYFGINLFIATLSFWIVNITSTMVLVHHVNSFSKYPITIYNRFIQIVLTCIIPFSFTSYYPAAYMLGKNVWIGMITPFVSALLLLISYQFWRFGLSRYQSAGG